MKKFLKIWAVCLLLICLVSPAITPSQLSSSQDSFIMDVQAETITQEASKGLTILIAMLLATGMRFASETAEGLKNGVTALWDKAYNAGKVGLTLAEIAASTFWQGRNMRMNATGMTAINAFQAWLQSEYNLTNGNSQVFQYEYSVGMQGVLEYTARACLDVGKVVINGSRNNAISYGTTSGRVIAFKSPSDYYQVAVYLVSSSSGRAGTAYNSCPTEGGGTLSSLGNGYYAGYMFSSNNANLVDLSIPFIEVSSHSGMLAYRYTYGDLVLDDRVVLEGQTNQLVDGYTPNADQVVSTDTDGLADYVGVGAISNTADLEAAINAAIAKGIADGLEGAIPWDLLKQALDQKVEGEDTEPIAPSEASAYKVLGLQNVFPFSIPFTLAQVFTLLEAEPVTPHFPLVMYVPGIIDYRDNVTLDDWEPVAKVTRNVGLLPLILGLILITRKIIKG